MYYIYVFEMLSHLFTVSDVEPTTTGMLHFSFRHNLNFNSLFRHFHTCLVHHSAFATVVKTHIEIARAHCKCTIAVVHVHVIV